jgi:hypothetical protein
MNFIHDLEIRKRNTEFIIKEATDFFNLFIPNKKTVGILLVLLHNVVGLFVLLYMVIFKDIDILFYVCLIFSIGISCMHFYFNGCILIRLERELLDDKKWCGVWTILFNFLEKFFNIKMNTKLANNIFICVMILLYCSIFIKFLYYY